MIYMIIENFHPGKVKLLYRRFDEKGRMMPDGLKYVDSWIAQDMSTCYQLMETDSMEKIYEWIGNWNDLADFEIVPVLTSAQAREKVFQTETN